MSDELDITMTRAAARRKSVPRPQAALHVVSPESLAMRVGLTAEALVVGRGDGEGIRLRHPTVSRRHLAITWDGRLGQHVGADLGSHNGSWVNGVRLGEHREALQDGAVMRLGDVVMVYERSDVLVGDDGGVVDTEAIPGASVAARRLRADVARAAPDPSPVLVVGETGTGKELISHELHRLAGRRGQRLAINCAELAPQLIESQLFGHERGAFTGATEARTGLFRAADGGTLFLDEIGELPLELQPKLLRVLQEGEIRAVGSTRSHTVDVRVVAATNRDLAALVESARFRRDLYARLALWEIQVPPLRRRRPDLMGWLRRLEARWRERRRSQTAALELDAEAVEAFLLHPFAENLRGVDRLVHQLAAHGEGVITRADLRAFLPDAPDAAPAAEVPVPDKRPAPATREELEAVLAECDGSVRSAARWYGRDRRQVYRWMEAFGLRES